MKPPSRVWKAGQRCRLTCGGRTVAAWIESASPNGVSLIVGFEGVLDPAGGGGGYAGNMPVMWNGRAFVDLAGRGVVELGE